MAQQKLGFGAAVVAALFTVLGFAAPAQAADDPATTVARHTVAAPDAALADAYWTADRMRSALPGELLAARAAERGTASPAVDVARGTHQRVGSRHAETHHDRDWDGDRDRGRRAEAAVAHIGKVFFTLDGANYVCSGNSVASENGDTVATAGHCLNSGAGTFATNFVFVPAYEDGAAPYGMWAAESLYTTQQWNNSGDLTYDTGFAVVSELNGEDLAQAVGASGVEFNAERGQAYTAYGYPAAAPYDGNRLISCEGEAADDPFNPQFESQGIPCTMTGGSSGGPWFLGDGPDGLQNSINSYGYLGQMTTMYGPYWGEVIQSAYQSAAVQ